MITSLAIAALAISTSAGRADSTELQADSLIKALRQGGYVLMVRHARTDWSTKDAENYSNTDRTTQRNLSNQGVADAKMIGQVMKRYAVPIGEIVSSPMFRTVETAVYGFGKPTTTMELRQFEASASQRALITQAPAPGTNRVLVTHHFIIERYAPGISPGDISESEAAVVRVNADGGLSLVGRFKLADWNRLLNGGHFAAPAVDGAAARLANAYLKAYNSGEADAMRAFLEASMIANPTRPLAARLDTYRKMFADYGPMTVVSLVSATESEASLKVQSKQGELTLTAATDSADTSRLRSVTVSRLSGGAGHR
jgi:phosphohistidine phosphatase SixA